MPRLLVGTSGYSYRHWRGLFYPRELKPSEWLAFYAQQFSAVELNVTFYRLPERDAFESWRRQTPDGFRFVLKGSRLITHYRRLRDIEEALDALLANAAGLGEKLEALLWQLPPKMPADPERLDAFCTLVRSRTPARHAFEFRDETWFGEAVYAVLRAHGCGLVVADAPGREPHDVLAADFTYLRFHGGSGTRDGGYSDAELARWARVARGRLEGDGTDVYAFFNNDFGGHAPTDARRLAKLLAGTISYTAPE